MKIFFLLICSFNVGLIPSFLPLSGFRRIFLDVTAAEEVEEEEAEMTSPPSSYNDICDYVLLLGGGGTGVHVGLSV